MKQELEILISAYLESHGYEVREASIDDAFNTLGQEFIDGKFKLRIRARK